MKKIIFSSAMALSFLCLNSAFGETSATQTITATLSSSVTVSNVGNSSISVQILEGGKLSADLTPSFKFSSNNKNGASATFNVKVNTSDNGQIDAISGINNSSSGIIVLANTSIKPRSSAVMNALSNNPTNNPDAISYQISFKIKDNDKGDMPVFNKTGNTACGNILTKTGSNTVTIIVDKNSVRKGSFSSEDESGSYQAIIYCTSADL
ncbi:MAG: hypothetical protein PHC34_04480 [Candidatus Gastranaerophilales bacterium]|nr:hypothetical protein [Candidatus Gastranaerophilales bacterium]